MAKPLEAWPWCSQIWEVSASRHPHCSRGLRKTKVPGIGLARQPETNPQQTGPYRGKKNSTSLVSHPPRYLPNQGWGQMWSPRIRRHTCRTVCLLPNRRCSHCPPSAWFWRRRPLSEHTVWWSSPVVWSVVYRSTRYEFRWRHLIRRHQKHKDLASSFVQKDVKRWSWKLRTIETHSISRIQCICLSILQYLACKKLNQTQQFHIIHDFMLLKSLFIVFLSKLMI